MHPKNENNHFQDFWKKSHETFKTYKSLVQDFRDLQTLIQTLFNKKAKSTCSLKKRNEIQKRELKVARTWLGQSYF